MRQHAPEVRAEVMASLLSGSGVAEIAREHGLPVSTVSDWKKDAWDRAGRSSDLGDLLLEFLGETLTTLVAQVRVYRDPEWLLKNPASQAAVLTGVLTDKVIRILEAMEPGGGGYRSAPKRIGVAVSVVEEGD